eukprot:g16406.t1
MDTNIIHHAGDVAAPKGGSGQFPYDSPLITPPCPTIQRRAHLPKVAPFFRKPVLAWIPEYLWSELAIPGIPCPRCGCKGSPDGWKPKGPRRVFMEHDVAYIIGFRYKCADCEIANKLVDRLADGLARGMSFSAAAKHIRESHVTKFMTDQLKYTSLAEIRRSGLVGLALVGGGVAPERFGDFDDVTKYCGATPTSRFMRDMWRKDFAKRPVLTVSGESWTREDYQHRVMQRWDGQILGGDASFKFAKVIRLGATKGGERARPVYGIFTVFNEYEQVVFQKPMKTNALSELMEDLKTLLYGRYIPNGFKLPVLSRVPKDHAARSIFLALLRDCFFSVNKADIEAVERVLRSEGLSPSEISDKKEKNWGFFLKNARRRVPCPDVLLQQFDAVIKACKEIRDAKAGQVLLSPAAMHAVALLREHIALGCFSDPDGVALYFERGKTSSGLTRYRCARGTNSTEGYHRYLRILFQFFCASPWMAHSVLMEFNYRWNIRMAVENRMMAPEVGAFSHQYMVDHIQHLSASWYPQQPLYPGWLAPVDFKDNGERTGLADNVLTFDGKPTGAAGEGCLAPDLHEEDIDSNDTNRIDERLPASLLLPSARRLGKLNDYTLPISPVTSHAEKQKFKDEYFQYYRQESGASARDHQRMDFSRWTSDWNDKCARIEAGQEDFSPIYRKTAGILQSYANKFRGRLNFTTTMAATMGPLRQLSKSLRQAAPAAEFSSSVGASQMPDPDRSLSSLLRASPTVIGATLAAARAAAAEVPPGMGAPMRAGQGGAGGDGGAAVGGSAGGSAGASAGGGGRRTKRGFRGCRECGHHKGAWLGNHPGPRSGQEKCSVPQNQRRDQSEKAYDGRQKKNVFSPCKCNQCQRSYDR